MPTEHMLDARNGITSEISDLNQRARDLQEEHAVVIRHAHHTKPQSQWARYNVRVRKRAIGCSIEWYMVSNIGTKDRPQPAYRTLSRGTKTGWSYPLSRFRRAPEWEMRRIMELEQQFGAIRERQAYL